MLSAMKAGRNSIGVEIDAEYCELAYNRLRKHQGGLFDELELHRTTAAEVGESKRALTAQSAVV